LLDSLLQEIIVNFQDASCYDQGRCVAEYGGRDHEGRCHEVW